MIGLTHVKENITKNRLNARKTTTTNGSSGSLDTRCQRESAERLAVPPESMLAFDLVSTTLGHLIICSPRGSDEKHR